MAPAPQQSNPDLCVVCELLLISHALQGSRCADTSVTVLMTYTLIVLTTADRVDWCDCCSFTQGWWWTWERITVPGSKTRQRLTDTNVDTIIACLILKDQMEITTMSPEMDWRCPVITVGNKLWSFFMITRLTLFFFWAILLDDAHIECCFRWATCIVNHTTPPQPPRPA